MLSIITNIIKKIFMGFLIIYSYNMLVPAEALLPLNLITILVTSLFKISGLLSLIIIKIIIY